MEKRMSAGFILGCIGGFINLLYAMLAAYSLFTVMPYQQAGSVLAGSVAVTIILIVVPLTNFIGACICRNKPAAGRAFMYVTGLLLLILFINSLSDIVSNMPQRYPSGMPANIIILYAVMITAQCLSVTAAALLSVPAGKEQAPEYGGMFDVYRDDNLKETPQHEFQAVHRLYNMPADSVSGPNQSADTKGDAE